MLFHFAFVCAQDKIEKDNISIYIFALEKKRRNNNPTKAKRTETLCIKINAAKQNRRAQCS